MHSDTRKLVQIDAPIHWLSFEPALDPLSSGDRAVLQEYQWIVWGGESGSKAREIDLPILDRLCAWYGEGRLPPLWIKQFGERHARQQGWRQVHGADRSEWPEWARIQETPLVA